MRWSKIKNIIILLLVMVNAVLLALVGFRDWNTRQAQRETEERVVALLERSGISYLPGDMPKDLGLTGCRVVTETPGPERAKALLGPVREELTAAEGYNVTYTGADGSQAVFSPSGEVRAQLVPGAVPLQGEEPGPAGAAFLEERLGVRVRETGSREENGRLELHYVQLWQGVPVPRMEVVLTCEDGGFTGFRGRLLWGEGEPVTGEDTLTAPTALARFLDELNRGEGYVCSQVTDLYPGYTAAGTTTVTLTPAWFIETDTWRFTVDGYTGAVTASE